MFKLKTKRDGGILDPDDILSDVVEDKELVSFKSLYIYSSFKRSRVRGPVRVSGNLEILESWIVRCQILWTKI